MFELGFEANNWNSSQMKLNSLYTVYKIYYVMYEECDLVLRLLNFSLGSHYWEKIYRLDEKNNIAVVWKVK